MLIPHRRFEVRELERGGRKPFAEWLKSLRDHVGKAAILGRLTRIEDSGNFGDYRHIGDGVFELKINVGPGYRIYFGLVQFAIVVILLGGHKTTQEKDIRKAKRFWQEYLDQQKRG